MEDDALHLPFRDVVIDGHRAIRAEHIQLRPLAQYRKQCAQMTRVESRSNHKAAPSSQPYLNRMIACR